MSGFSSVETLFDLIASVEKEGARFYQRLAKRANNEGIRDVFLQLSRDEERHAEELVRSARSILDTPDANLSASLLELVREMLNDSQSHMQGAEPFDIAGVDFSQALKIGMQNEKGSIEVYTRMATLFPGKPADVFRRLACEEQGHFEKLMRIREKRLL